MNQPLQPSASGQIIGFQRKLYEELLHAGYVNLPILKMSLSTALLARYGSPDAVDEALGEGTYKGVKQVHGELVGWQKAWAEVREEQNAHHLLRLESLVVSTIRRP